MNKKRVVNLALLLLAAVIAVVPLLLVKDSEFAGADTAAMEAVGEIHEGFEPWFRPIWEPPGTETESFLFALQAALGSGVIFYCLGYWKGRNDTTKNEKPQA